MSKALVPILRQFALNHLPETVDFPSLQRAMLEQIADGTGQKPPPHETIHHVVPGFYIRTWKGSAGTLVFTMLHKQRHVFTVSKGKAMVWEPGKPGLLVTAPFHGITEPGTQRLLFVLEEIMWTTFHQNPDDETDIPTLEARLSEIPNVEALTP